MTFVNRQSELRWLEEAYAGGRAFFAEFVGPVFEEVCRQHLRHLGREGKLPFRPDRVGSFCRMEGRAALVCMR